jgi:hypothetical protein
LIPISSPGRASLHAECSGLMGRSEKTFNNHGADLTPRELIGEHESSRPRVHDEEVSLSQHGSV